MITKKPSDNDDAIRLTYDELIGIVGIRNKPKKGSTSQIDAIFEEKFEENIDALDEECPMNDIEKEYRKDNDIEKDADLNSQQEEEIEEMRFKCEDEVRSKQYVAIKNAVETVSEKLLDKVGLNIEFESDKPINAKSIFITPQDSWDKSAHELWVLADCSGLGSATSFREYKENEEKSGKELTKDLLGWIKTHHECYGDDKDPEDQFDQDINDSLR